MRADYFDNVRFQMFVSALHGSHPFADQKSPADPCDALSHRRTRTGHKRSRLSDWHWPVQRTLVFPKTEHAQTRQFLTLDKILAKSYDGCIRLGELGDRLAFCYPVIGFAKTVSNKNCAVSEWSKHSQDG